MQRSNTLLSKVKSLEAVFKFKHHLRMLWTLELINIEISNDFFLQAELLMSILCVIFMRQFSPDFRYFMTVWINGLIIDKKKLAFQDRSSMISRINETVH
jgi:hypothetical protein